MILSAFGHNFIILIWKTCKFSNKIKKLAKNSNFTCKLKCLYLYLNIDLYIQIATLIILWLSKVEYYLLKLH